jgi:hypothetical protein
MVAQVAERPASPQQQAQAKQGEQGDAVLLLDQKVLAHGFPP